MVAGWHCGKYQVSGTKLCREGLAPGGGQLRLEGGQIPQINKDGEAGSRPWTLTAQAQFLPGEGLVTQQLAGFTVDTWHKTGSSAQVHHAILDIGVWCKQLMTQS